MAYNVDQTTLNDSINNNPALDTSTKEAITKYLASLTGTFDSPAGQTTIVNNWTPGTSVPAGTGVLYVDPSYTGTDFSGLSNVPVILFQGSAGHTVQLGGSTDQIVVFSGGNNVYTNSGTGNDTITTGNGNNSVVTGGGGDSITLGSGNNTVNSGFGSDTIVAGKGNASIMTGGGNDTVVLNLGGGLAARDSTSAAASSSYVQTVDGGSGFNVINVGGKMADYSSTVNGNSLVVTNLDSNNQAVLSNSQFIQFNDGVIINAGGDTQAIVARMYEAALNRTADAGGLDGWWKAGDAQSLQSIANGFLNSSEFKAQGSLNDEQFVTKLYSNLLDRAPDTQGLAGWVSHLSDGSLSRADVLVGFAASGEAVADYSKVINVITNSTHNT